ncbi:MAG TPA: universal stress protein [Mucilaginibacter sp.]
MKTLLIINDNSFEAKHAAEFVLAMAQKTGANIMLANTVVNSRKSVEKVTAGNIVNIGHEAYLGKDSVSEMLYHLKLLNDGRYAFKPEIKEFDVSGMNENELIEFINRNHIWMMVKGMTDETNTSRTRKSLNIQAVLNRVLCPLLLIPSQWRLKDIERLTYIADLRYCRIQVVRYLADLARPWSAALSIAHMSANGLPDMAEKYALTVFSEEVNNNVNYDQLFFNNIKEKDLAKVIDVVINGMHNDILVMVNHRFHFEEIVGRYITDTLPLNITIPLLIFPY